ncbi:hypothetical protein BU17DRAFT_102098 [Hysterangium stoloniferum]|nr:hypothetical protein BU17DRAFT_102098 [Hysterangium stoloniferum]
MPHVPFLRGAKWAGLAQSSLIHIWQRFKIRVALMGVIAAAIVGAIATIALILLIVHSPVHPDSVTNPSYTPHLRTSRHQRPFISNPSHLPSFRPAPIFQSRTSIRDIGVHRIGLFFESCFDCLIELLISAITRCIHGRQTRRARADTGRRHVPVSQTLRARTNPSNFWFAVEVVPVAYSPPQFDDAPRPSRAGLLSQSLWMSLPS